MHRHCSRSLEDQVIACSIPFNCVHCPQPWNRNFSLVGRSVDQEGPDSAPVVGCSMCWNGPSMPVRAQNSSKSTASVSDSCGQVWTSSLPHSFTLSSAIAALPLVGRCTCVRGAGTGAQHRSGHMMQWSWDTHQSHTVSIWLVHFVSGSKQPCTCYSGVQSRFLTVFLSVPWFIKPAKEAHFPGVGHQTLFPNMWFKLLAAHGWSLSPWYHPSVLCHLLRGMNPNLIISIRSDQISRSVVSDSLWPHESQHARPPCPSPTPGVHPNSCASSRWCHPAISSSVVPFSSWPQSLSGSGSFPVSQLFAWGGQSTGVSASASFLPKNTQGWSPSEWTGWISYKILASGPITSWQIDGETMKTVRGFIFLVSKITVASDCSHEFTSGHTHWGNQKGKRHMYPNVHRSTVYNSQDMEAT